MLPNFLVVGAQKAGTTSLHRYLIDHPDLYLPSQKETKFFVIDERYEKGLKFYESEYYSSWGGEKAVGEVDPDYMYFPVALKRIKKCIQLDELKIIIILRNPVDRAFSHYLMTFRRGLEPLTFEEAIDREASRIGRNFESNMHYSYIHRGYYMSQINRFREKIDDEKIHIVLSEDLLTRPRHCIRNICTFLDIATDYVPIHIHRKYHIATAPRSMSLLHRIENRDSPEKKLLRILLPWKSMRHKLREQLLRWNQSTGHGISLDKNTRKQLISIFQRENEQLAEYIGRDLGHWNEV